MRNLTLCCLFPLGLLFGACGAKATQATEDSQTHWLKSCSTDATCGDLSCVCGRCVELCADGDRCSDKSRDCFDAKSKASASLCADEKPSAVCLEQCDSDSPCPGNQDCVAGACVPEANEVDEVDEPIKPDVDEGDGGGDQPQPSQQPCEGKTCGESCQLCAPDDGKCTETEEVKRCDASGECTPGQVECASDCASRGAMDCELSMNCSASMGTPVGEKQARFAACVNTAEACQGGDTAVTCAARPGGETFVFPTTCLPPGFVALDGNDPKCNVYERLETELLVVNRSAETRSRYHPCGGAKYWIGVYPLGTMVPLGVTGPLGPTPVGCGPVSCEDLGPMEVAPRELPPQCSMSLMCAASRVDLAPGASDVPYVWDGALTERNTERNCSYERSVEPGTPMFAHFCFGVPNGDFEIVDYSCKEYPFNYGDARVEIALE